MTTLWNRAKPLNQPPHYGGLSLSAGKATRTTPHLSIVQEKAKEQGQSLKQVSDVSDAKAK